MTMKSRVTLRNWALSGHHQVGNEDVGVSEGQSGDGGRTTPSQTNTRHALEHDYIAVLIEGLRHNRTTGTVEDELMERIERLLRRRDE